MNAMLAFDLPEDESSFEAACKAGAMQSALFEVGQEIFRPARKHGYSDRAIHDLLEKIGDDGIELIHLLEQRFYQIINDHDINLL